MAIEYKTGDDYSAGGKYLKTEGWFHLCVTDATDTVTKADGSLVAGAMFQVSCTVCEGTAPACRDKLTDLTFFHPKPDKPEFGMKKIDRALIALNVLKPEEKSKELSFEPSDLIGQQFIAHLELDQNGKYLQLAFADIFHVDDAEVAQFPRDEQMLSILPAECRRIGAVSGGQKPASTPKPAPAMDLDDIDI